MRLKYLKTGLILVWGKVKKGNNFIRVEKVFYSRQELLEFWATI